MKTYKKIVPYFTPYWKLIILGLLVKFIGTLLTLFSFLMIIPFFEVLFSNQPLIENPVAFEWSVEAFKHNFYYLLSEIVRNYGSETALISIGLFVLLMVTLQSLCRYYVSYTQSRVSQSAGRDIRQQMFRHIIYLPLTFFEKRRKGDILSRFGVDVAKFQSFVVNSVFTVLTALVSLFVYLFALFYIHVNLTLLILALSIPAIWIVNRVGKRLREMTRTGMESLGSNMSFIDSIIYGIKTVKTFNAERNVIKGFRKVNNRLTHLMIRLGRRNAILTPVTRLMGMTALVIIMILGGILILRSNTGISSQAFVSYLVVVYQLINPARSLSNIYYNMQQGMASFHRIDEIMQVRKPVYHSSRQLQKIEFNQMIEYQNVSFKYDTSWALQNINATIPKGHTIALVGRSGAGKSTFADLLPRFYELDKGDILIDGISVNQFDVHALRNLTGIVSQESILFHESIADNIAFSKPGANREEVMEAAKIAHAHDFILALDQGYDTQIGERGVKLSGGERQRITIARAILNNPSILILDEATSELDSESEKLVQDALEELMKNRTTLVIAHRLSTIQNADRILVFDHGEIKEQGSFNELIEKNGIFRSLYEKQYGGLGIE